MTTTKLSQLLVWMVLGASLTTSCGNVGPLATDGGAGHGGSIGSTGSAGNDGSAGSTGSAGQGGTTGAAGEGGTTGEGGAAGTLGGAPGNPVGCGSASQRGECEAISGCAFFQAPSCNGNPGITFCYSKGSAVDYFCPPPPPSCSSLDAAACQTRSDCRLDHCTNCSGGDAVHCSALTDPQSSCPHCPAPCSQVTNLSDCSVRPDCHAVYQDPGNCSCADPGCCAKFSFCADGNEALCFGDPVCKSVRPHCEGIFVVSYTGTCYEGCVEKTDCSL